MGEILFDERVANETCAPPILVAFLQAMRAKGTTRLGAGAQPPQYERVIRMKTATALGLTIPPSLLQRADPVIG